MPFKPGQSGNPGGRPRTDPRIEAYRNAKTLPALKRLYKLTRDGDPKVAVQALKVFLAKCLPDMRHLDVSEAPVALPEGLTLDEVRDLARAAKEAKKAKPAGAATPH